MMIDKKDKRRMRLFNDIYLTFLLVAYTSMAIYFSYWYLMEYNADPLLFIGLNFTNAMTAYMWYLWIDTFILFKRRIKKLLGG
jgi:hypothetical protein